MPTSSASSPRRRVSAGAESPAMRVGVIQSCYAPWRGYLDFIASCDLFVVYDDVQYSSGEFRNRNRLKLPSGLRWITVPVAYRFGDRIDQVRIGSPREPWREEHRRLLRESLAEAPHAQDALAIWEEGVAAEQEHLTPLNVGLLRRLMAYLGIGTKLAMSSDFALEGRGTERLIDLLGKVGARSYLSGPSARAYLDEAAFRAAGMGLAYKTYDYAPYPQSWGPFEGAVTVLDLIAHCGHRARDHLTSRTPAEVAVP